MKTFALVIFGFFAATTDTREGRSEASPATAVASGGVIEPQIRVIGRLNVNTASREQLLQVPGLDPGRVDALIAARPLRDLATQDLPAVAASHLKTDGESTFTRIQKGPLVRLDASPSRAR